MNEYLTALREEPGVSQQRSPSGSSRWRPDPDTTTDRSLRREFAKTYAWGIPNQEAIRELVTHSPLVELGAGNGYWAHRIEQAGGQVIAIDPDPPNRTWATVQTRTHESLTEYQDYSLFLCWPTHNAGWSADAVKSYTGDTLVYVGEPHGGITGTRDMHRAISETFGLAETVIPIPQWGSNTDKMYVFTR